MSAKNYSREEIEKKVNEIIAEKMFIDESDINTKSQLGFDIGADSIDIIGIIVDLELCFNIHFSDEVVDGITGSSKVGKLYDTVEDLLK